IVLWLSTMIFIRASIWYALSRLITTFRTAIEKQVSMITEPMLKSEEIIRIFHRIEVQNFPSFKRVLPLRVIAPYVHSICETVYRYHGTVSALRTTSRAQHPLGGENADTRCL